MKLLRVIRFDQSDDHVFDMTAVADEWAVSGAAVFTGLDRSDLKGKLRQAFANGFLGVPSMGRSTFCSVAEFDDAEVDHLVMELAKGFVERFGAPSLGEAVQAAREEVQFAAGLCDDLPINTVLTVRRVMEDDGDMREEFRQITPPSGEPRHARIWEVETDDA